MVRVSKQTTLSKLSSTSLSTQKSAIAGLIMAATCGAVLSAEPVLAADPPAVTATATITHYNGDEWGTAPEGYSYINKNDATGVDVTRGEGNGSLDGLKVEVNADISGTSYGVETHAVNGGPVAIVLNADVTSTANHGISTATPTSDFELSGTGNVTGQKRGINVWGRNVSINGTGDVTAGSGLNSAAIRAIADSGGDLTITQSGAITSSNGFGIVAAHRGYGKITVGKPGQSIGTVTTGATGYQSINISNLDSFSDSIGDISLYTDNAIINNNTGGASGIFITTKSSKVDISVADVTMVDATTGHAITLYVDENTAKSSNVTINGTITSGNVANGSKAIYVNGNAAQAANITNNSNGVINGLIDVASSNVATSVFDNKGIWNNFNTSTFSGKLLNSGTINMQNSMADTNINISGDIELTSSSILKIDVDTSGNSDSITTTSGNMALGGTLDVVAVGDQALYSATSGTSYTLVANSGASTVSGAFATLTEDFAFLDLEVDYAGGSGNDVTFKFVKHVEPVEETTETTTTPTTTPTAPSSSGIDFKPHATGNNQNDAAMAMDNFDYGTTDGAKLETEFLKLTNAQAKDAIKQISGGDHQSANHSAAPIAAAFQTAMMGGSIGSGASTGGGASSGSEPQVVGYTVSATGEEIDIKLWARALGGFSHLKNPSGAALTTQSFGVIAGAEFAAADDLTLGASVGYTRANFSVQTAGSSSQADNFHTGLSGSWGARSAFDTGLGISGGLDVTSHQYKTVRKINIGAITRTASSTSSGLTIGGTLNARYGIAIGDMVVSPFVGLDLARTANNGFVETGAGALNITTKANSSKHIGTLVGAQLAGKFDDNQVSISAAWRHEFGDTSTAASSKLAGSAVSFNSTTPTEARNKIIVNGSLSIPTSDNGSLTFSAFGEASRTSLNLGASASFKLKF